MSHDQTPGLRQLADQAMNEHGAAPQAAAERLRAGFALLPGEAGAADAFARVLEHVLLGHLDRAAELAAALDRLQALAHDDAALATTLLRARLAIALVDDTAAAQHSALPAAERIRAHCNAALARCRRGEWSAVRERMDAARRWLQPLDDTGALRAYAAMMNNIASDIEQELRPAQQQDAQRVAVMLEAASRAREAWSRAGGWRETERADYLLALCHAKAGQGEQAMVHAQACLALCEANGGDPFECFFAHEALLRAHLAARRPEAASGERARMVERLQMLQDPDLRPYAQDTLAAVDALLAAAADQ